MGKIRDSRLDVSLSQVYILHAQLRPTRDSPPLASRELQIKQHRERERERGVVPLYKCQQWPKRRGRAVSATPTATVRREPMRVLTACIGEKTNGGVIEAAYWYVRDSISELVCVHPFMGCGAPWSLFSPETYSG